MNFDVYEPFFKGARSLIFFARKIAFFGLRFSISPHCHRDDGGRPGEYNAISPRVNTLRMIIPYMMKV